ncbi:hypothetical protein ACF1GW_38920 [Streptomyces achromogenes]|uniref:hypothetical protein n=1 Tax=Streptomyces achromogenes TaxID=67255 RepID=UPI0036FD7D82
MPLITQTAIVGTIRTVVPAAPGWRVAAYAPAGTDIGRVPTPTHVVAWALMEAATEPGGCITVPVFVAGVRTWTPDQFRAVYGAMLELHVVPA